MIFSCILIININTIAASQLYFPSSANNGTASSSSTPSTISPQVSFPSKEEIVTAQRQLGPNIYVRLSNATEGPPSQLQGVTVANATITNNTMTNNTMFVTWIGNGTTVYLSIIQGKGSSLEDHVVGLAKQISLNNTVNASNLQITAIPGLTSITWDAIDVDTGLRNVYGSLSRDGKYFYSFQISSGLNDAFNPWQPNPHFVLYIEIGDPNSVCKGPQPNADTSSNATATNSIDVISQSGGGTTNNLGSLNATAGQGSFPGVACLYRWA
jgi:hypothetical protein